MKDLKIPEILILAVVLTIASHTGTFALASDIDLDELQKTAAGGGANIVALLLYSMLRRPS